jgi:3'(2'), 5'-bisphosphate nucleotidase
MKELLDHSLGNELRFGLGLTEDCCRLAERVRRRLVAPTLRKEDRSPVTVADFAVQALVGCRLSRTFPGATLVAEEAADFLKEPENRPVLESVVEHLREFEEDAEPEQVLDWVDLGKGDPRGEYWVLDPIDGTKGFLRNAHYAVALALVLEGDLRLGILGCPRLHLAEDRAQTSTEPADPGTLSVALRGEGAWWMPLGMRQAARSLRVSSVRDLGSAVLLRSVEQGHTNLDQVGRLMLELGISARPVAMDSQAKYGLLANGQGDLLVRLLSQRHPDYREKIWDQAAGVLIVEEAGGRVTDLDGKGLDFTAGRQLERNRGVLATNRQIHERILEGLRDLRA